MFARAATVALLRPGSPGVQTPCGGTVLPWVPNALAALIACLLMGATRCITLEQRLQIDPVAEPDLIVGMMPFSTTFQKTGGVELAAQGLLRHLRPGRAAPALHSVVCAHLDHRPLRLEHRYRRAHGADRIDRRAGSWGVAVSVMMTIALATSAAFMTPVSSPVNTLVLVPGRYRFEDFVRIGVPFTFIALLITVLLVPWLLPLRQ